MVYPRRNISTIGNILQKFNNKSPCGHHRRDSCQLQVEPKEDEELLVRAVRLR